MSSGGAMWNGTKAASNTPNTVHAFPTPAATGSQVATLPRFNMPSADSTFQRSYVTPNVNSVAGKPQQLHPEPTPYSGMMRHPGATNK